MTTLGSLLPGQNVSFFRLVPEVGTPISRLPDWGRVCESSTGHTSWLTDRA